MTKTKPRVRHRETLDLGKPVSFKGPSVYAALQTEPYGDWVLAMVDDSPLPDAFKNLKPSPNLAVLTFEAKKIINANPAHRESQ